MAMDGAENRMNRRDFLVGASTAVVGSGLLAGWPAMIGPRAEAVMIDGVGHFMLVEKPEEVNSHILGFLAR
jgi:pimeloyl-ACP methyl ester carboxylesterase